MIIVDSVDHTISSVCFLLQLDILLNGNPVDALAVIIHKEKAYSAGKRICVKLKETIHRFAYHTFVVVLY